MLQIERYLDYVDFLKKEKENAAAEASGENQVEEEQPKVKEQTVRKISFSSQKKSVFCACFKHYVYWFVLERALEFVHSECHQFPARVNGYFHYGVVQKVLEE